MDEKEWHDKTDKPQQTGAPQKKNNGRVRKI